MSEPTLYQEDLNTADTDLGGFVETRDRYLEALRAWGVLVPVEPNYEAATKGARDAAAWADEEVSEGRMDVAEWWYQIAAGALRAGIGDNDGE